MSVNVTVNGQSGPSVVATNGDTISAAVTKNASVNVSASAAAAPGGIGATGPQGAPSTTITVGNVSTLSAGSSATVAGTSSNNGANLTLAFGIPVGAAGANGITPTFSASASTLSAGSSATVAATSTNGGANVALAFGIPQGVAGSGGSNLTLSDATPVNLGTAAPGTSNLAARADHTHNLPVIAYGNLSGVPSNFPTNTTLVSGLSAGYSGINHAHNYVTAVNNLTGALTLAAGSNVTLTANGSTLTLSSSAGGLGANDSVDGGDYIGEILNGITFGTQPQSQSLTSTTTLTLGSFTPQAQNGVPLGDSQYGYTLAGSLAGSSVAGFGNNIFAVRTWNNGTQGSGFINMSAVVSSADNGMTWSQLLTLTTAPDPGVPIRRGGDVAVVSNGTRHAIATGTYYLNSSATALIPIESSIRYSDSSNLSNATLSNTAIGGAMSVAYSNTASRWCAINYPTFNGTAWRMSIFSSSDCDSWTQRVSIAGTLGKIVSCGNRLIAASDSSSVILKSTDGVSWSNGAANVASLSDLASNGTRAVMVGSGYLGNNLSRCYYTADGDTWANVTLPVQCNRIAHASGLFCAWNDASSTTDVCTSPNGLNWTLRTLPSSANLAGAASASGSNTIFFTSASNTAYNAVLSTSAASASLTVSASVSGGAAVSYQWQSSTDAGTTWANVSNATSSTLSLTALTTANSGTRYRAAASATGATTVTSQSATLTVTG